MLWTRSTPISGWQTNTPRSISVTDRARMSEPDMIFDRFCARLDMIGGKAIGNRVENT